MKLARWLSIADCSVTEIRSKIPSGGSWPGPPAWRYANRVKPASSRSLDVSVEVQVSCVTQYGKSKYPVLASGEVVVEPSAIQSALRARQPLPFVVSVEPSQRY